MNGDEKSDGKPQAQSLICLSLLTVFLFLLFVATNFSDVLNLHGGYQDKFSAYGFFTTSRLCCLENISPFLPRVLFFFFFLKVHSD